MSLNDRIAGKPTVPPSPRKDDGVRGTIDCEYDCTSVSQSDTRTLAMDKVSLIGPYRGLKLMGQGADLGVHGPGKNGMLFREGYRYRVTITEIGESFPVLKEACDKPPPGWKCTRPKGHEGPCAAVVDTAPAEDAT